MLLTNKDVILKSSGPKIAVILNVRHLNIYKVKQRENEKMVCLFEISDNSNSWRVKRALKGCGGRAFGGKIHQGASEKVAAENGIKVVE